MRITGESRAVKKVSRILAFVLGALLLAAAAASAEVLLENWGRRPLAFEENRGQTDGRVRFLARAPGYALFLTPGEAVVAPQGGPALRLRWVGARASRIAGEAELPGRTHYLVGDDPARWRTGIPSFARVRYRDVYPGIDLVFHGDPRQVEYDFVVAPGADLRKVRIALKGAEKVRIDRSGDVVLRSGGEELRLLRPVAYQEVGGARRQVASRWRRTPGGALGFAVGRYDRRRPLVIDPVIVYSTYLGGGSRDIGRAIAVDAQGNAYAAGYSASTDFPAPAGPSSPSAGQAFITKLDPAGQLVFSTFLGGQNSIDEAHAVEVDAAGFIYVAGETHADDFPLVNPLPPQFLGEGADVFVSKLHPSGASLAYSTRLGGLDLDAAYGLAVDSQGRAYVAGLTFSVEFPLVDPLDLSGNGFVAKLGPSGSELVYSTYYGESTYFKDVAVDAAGAMYLAGRTDTNELPGPAPVPYHGAGDAFATKLAPSGSSVIYVTVLGGQYHDTGNGIAVDAAGRAYVAGTTQSDDFPAVRPLQPRGGQDDAFVVRLDPAGGIDFSSCFGGTGEDLGWGIALDGAGGVYLTGEADSPDFPRQETTPLECEGDCQNTAFVAHLNADRAELVYSVLLRNRAASLRKDANYTFSSGQAVAAGPQGDAYAAGWTFDPEFLTVNAFQLAWAGAEDAFVVRVARIAPSSNQPPVCAAAAARPDRIWPPNGKLRPISIRGVTDPDGDSVSLTITSIRQDEPLSRRGSPDGTGVGASTAQVRADRKGGGDGRVYHLAFEANDGHGGACAGEVTVCVPHDQARRTCGDGGALVDSTGR